MNKDVTVDNEAKNKLIQKTSTKRIREEKPRKKVEKNVDHVLKALHGLETSEERIAVLCQKYAQICNEHRTLQISARQAERKNCVLQKEKEQLQTEHSKAVLTRSRLENLCRELQRQNKAIKEECMLKIREEGEKKREVAAKFHTMLSEIGSLLAQNNDKNAKLRDDNLDMSARLKSVCDQFEKKEQHVENLAKQMQLEMQLADAKLAKAKMEMDIEKETLQKEKQQLLIELADYKRKLCEMKASEISLREQIQIYSDKYEEFHKALLQSNAATGEFKAEMDRMVKHIRRLEKETAAWKSRYDIAQSSLASVTEEKIVCEQKRAVAERRLAALQGICRGLQDHCRQLREEKKMGMNADETYKRFEEQMKEVDGSTDLVESVENIFCLGQSSEDGKSTEAVQHIQLKEVHDSTDLIESVENISCLGQSSEDGKSTEAVQHIQLKEVHDSTDLIESVENISCLGQSSEDGKSTEEVQHIQLKEVHDSTDLIESVDSISCLGQSSENVKYPESVQHIQIEVDDKRNGWVPEESDAGCLLKDKVEDQPDVFQKENSAYLEYMSVRCDCEDPSNCMITEESNDNVFTDNFLNKNNTSVVDDRIASGSDIDKKHGINNCDEFNDNREIGPTNVSSSDKLPEVSENGSVLDKKGSVLRFSSVPLETDLSINGPPLSNNTEGVALRTIENNCDVKDSNEKLDENSFDESVLSCAQNTVNDETEESQIFNGDQPEIAAPSIHSCSNADDSSLEILLTNISEERTIISNSTDAFVNSSSKNKKKKKSKK